MKKWTSIGYILKGVRRQLDIPRVTVYERLQVLPHTLNQMEQIHCEMPVPRVRLDRWLDVLDVSDRTWYHFHSYRWHEYIILKQDMPDTLAQQLATIVATAYINPDKTIETAFNDKNNILTMFLDHIPKEPGTVVKSIYINEEEDKRCGRNPKK